MKTFEQVQPVSHDLISPIEQSPDLMAVAHDVGSLLVARGLRFRAWSGMQAAEIGGHRMSQDVDLWMPDGTIDRVPGFLRNNSDHPIVVDDLNDRYIIGIGHNREVEIMARMDIHASDGNVYPLRMTSDVTLQSHPAMRLGKWRLPFAPPEDTMLLKGILQRGESVGKHDKEDVVAMLGKISWVNEAYLAHRIQQSGAEKRAVPFLRECGLALACFD